MLLKEIRQALRMLANNPSFSIIAVLSLALGIGATSSIFSMADALLLRPLPVPEPTGIVTVSGTTPGNSNAAMSYPDYLDLRAKSRSFDGMVAFQLFQAGLATTASAVPQMKMGMQVSDNFFQVLGVDPALGRRFLPEECQVPGRNPVAILSYDLWQKQFAGDRNIVGRNVRLNGIDFAVVGIAPESFTGMDQYIRPAMYVPLMMAQRLKASDTNPLDQRNSHSLDIKGRLKPGVTRQAAQAEMIAIAKNLEKAYPETNRNRSVAVETELQARVQQSPPDAALAAMMMALVGLVLIIACANVANLILARARNRSREVAIRLALGVARWRLVRQLMIESLVLALSGAALGIAFGYGGIRFLQAIPIPTDLPVVIGVQLDRRVLLFSLLAAIVCSVFFGIAPAWQALRTDLVSSLRSAGLVTSARVRTIGRNVLVIGQVALSLILIVAASMLVDGFRKLLALNPGFRTDHIMLMEFDTALTRYTPEQSREFYRNLTDRARALPGVRQVALSQAVPMAPNQAIQTVTPEGYQFPKGQEFVTLFGEPVDDHYFETLKVPIVRGRAFTSADKADSHGVAIVNQAFAEKYWPNQDAIGKRIHLTDPAKTAFEIVGVAKTSRYLFISEPPLPFVYLPFAQHPSSRMTLLVETIGDPADAGAPLRNIVRTLDANMPIYNARTFDSFYHQRAIVMVRMLTEIVGTMGLVGLTLSLIGLYSLIAYSISRRTQEIGIRMALGAYRSNVLKMVLRQGFVLSIIGIGIGFIGSIAVRNLLNQGLVGLGTTSPALLAIVPLLLMAVTMLACYLPARRASRIDPIRALRYE